MNQLATNLKSILMSLATIFSTMFRKVGYVGSGVLDTLRTIIIFGCTALIGLAIFIYALIMAIVLPQTKEELT
jgi:hypothetical protein